MDITQTYQLAVEHQRAGRLAEAEKLYRQILAEHPNHADSLHMLGVLTHQGGRHVAGIQLIRQAIALAPREFAYYGNLAAALAALGQTQERIAALRTLVSLRPDLPEGHYELGCALQDGGDFDAAAAAYESALALRPTYPEALENLTTILQQKRRLPEAMQVFDRALAADPNSYPVHYILANCLFDAQQLDQAIAAYKRSFELCPTFAAALNNLGNAYRERGEAETAIKYYQRGLHLQNHPRWASNLLYALHSDAAYDRQRLYEEHMRWSRQFAKPLYATIQPHRNDRTKDRRLRVAFSSPDLWNHPIGRFLLPILRELNRDQFEVFCYSDATRDDEMSAKIRSLSNQWKQTTRLNDEQLAAVIRRDQIDILVDLAMHTAGNRMLMFARKPAPVQVTYLAYCSTTGLETIDYRLSDSQLDPNPDEDRWYSEQTVRLQSYWCYDSPPVQLGRSAPPARSGITFGSMNSFAKVSPTALRAWAAILRQTPGSQMMIHAWPGSHRQAAADLMQQEGVHPDRLTFVDRQQMAEYFQQYQQIDIALDTFAFAGGTTSCDALWMGVPLVTLAGATATSRGGASILTNVGLPHLIASSLEQYIDIACKLAADRSALSKLRSELPEQMRASRLMNARAAARDFENSLRQMWLRWEPS